MSSHSEFLAAIQAAGMSPKKVEPGKWCRFAGIGKGNGNTSGFAFLFPDGQGGIYGDFASGMRETWQHERVSRMTEEDRVAWQTLIREAQAEAERKQSEAWAEAAVRAKEVWDTLPDAPEGHKYLAKKQVKGYGIRIKENALVMPLSDSEGVITTYQAITEDGDKKLMYGGRMKGCAFAIPGKASPVYVCEGYATAASIHEATGCSVLVAVCASNLGPVVEAFLRKNKDTKVIIAADNDHGGKVNTGVMEAEKVREKHPQVSVCFPPAIEGRKGTDWNDYAVSYGVEAAKRLLSPSRVQGIRVRDLMATAYKPVKWAVPGIIPEGLTVLAGRPKFGKSWLMLALAYDIATGGKVWGFIDTPAPVTAHYFALEDSERRMQDRIAQMEGYIDQYPDNMHIYTHMPRIGEGFIDELDAVVDRSPDTGLIIIDTLAKVRPVGGVKSNANLYSSEYEDLGQLQRWAIGRGIPVVVIHHTRKGGQGTKHGNPFDELSGSSGIQGVADTIIVCHRDHGSNEAKMFVTGREVGEAEYRMVFQKHCMSWEVSPSDDAPVVDTSVMLLEAWFRDRDSLTTVDAAKLWDTSQSTARRRLEEMVRDGTMTQEVGGFPRMSRYKKVHPADSWIDRD